MPRTSRTFAACDIAHDCPPTSRTTGEVKAYTQLFRSYQDYSRYLYKSLGLDEHAHVDTTGAFTLDPRLDRIVLELQNNLIGVRAARRTAQIHGHPLRRGGV